MRPTHVCALVLFGGTASAADYPKLVEADVVLKDFRFATGETLDVKTHYHTLGQPRRDKTGKGL
jgi:homoserine O-acetyltransferase